MALISSRASLNSMPPICPALSSACQALQSYPFLDRCVKLFLN